MKTQKAYRSSSKAQAAHQLRWPVIIFSALVFAALLMFSMAAGAQETDSAQKAQYDVYAGGIHALEVNLVNDLSKTDQYEVTMDAKTYGMLGKLAPWSGTFNTKGWKGDIFMPEQHQSSALWRGEEELKTYRYKKDGRFESYTIMEQGVDKTPKELDSVLTENTTDILTATLNTMRNIAVGQSCDSTTEIFDGKRRYKLHFNKKADVTLAASRYNIYDGPAIECTAVVEPVAGKWHEKPRGWASIQEQGRQKGSLPTVWFAKVEEGKPAIPVKVRVKTDYGTLFMHLTNYNGQSNKLVMTQ